MMSGTGDVNPTTAVIGLPEPSSVVPIAGTMWTCSLSFVPGAQVVAGRSQARQGG